MALFTCPECGHDVSTTADKCPNCGFNIAKYLEEQKRAEEEKERKIEEEQRKRRLEEDRLEKEIRRKAIFLKYFGTPKKKAISNSAIIIVIAAIIVTTILYLNSTEDYREVKELINDIEQRIVELNNDIDRANSASDDNTKLSRRLDLAIDLKILDSKMAKTIEQYNALSEKDRNSINRYLSSRYITSWDELTALLNSFGVKSKSVSEYNKKAENQYYDLYTELASSLMKGDFETGDVKVTSISHSYSGDNFEVTGSVKNTTNSTVYFVQVKISLKDSKGNVINTDSTYAVGDEGLSPNESSTFTCFIDRVSGADQISAYVYDYN